MRGHVGKLLQFGVRPRQFGLRGQQRLDRLRVGHCAGNLCGNQHCQFLIASVVGVRRTRHESHYRNHRLFQDHRNVHPGPQAGRDAVLQARRLSQDCRDIALIHDLRLLAPHHRLNHLPAQRPPDIQGGQWHVDPRVVAGLVLPRLAIDHHDRQPVGRDD